MRKAYKLADELGGSATHCLILADDMLPSRDAAAHVEEIARIVGDRAVTFFTMDRQMMTEAIQAGRSWVTTLDGAWGGSIMIPRQWVQGFVDWSDATFIESYKHDDARMAAYVYTHELGSWWHTVPPLFQHACAIASLSGQNNSRRVSHLWRPEIGEMDWSIDVPWRGASSRTRMVNLDRYLTPWGEAYYEKVGKKP